MKNRTTRNGMAENRQLLSRALCALMPFQSCRSPKEKNDGTAWRGLNTPAHVPACSDTENDKERHGTAWNGKRWKTTQPGPNLLPEAQQHG